MADAALHTSALGADALDDIEAISLRAFDHRYGEAWSKAQCLSVLALPGYRIIGAWRGQGAGASLVGYAITRSVADESELLLLAVDPAQRRQGVAATLMKQWLNSAYERGVVRAFLEMRTDNDARALYAAHGFVEIAVRSSYYRGNDGVMRDAVTMQRRLDSSPIER